VASRGRQSPVQREEFFASAVVGVGGWSIVAGQVERQLVKVDALPPAAVSDARLAAGILNEDAAHRLRRRPEEVGAAVERLRGCAVDEPQVRLVDEGGGL